MVSDITRDGSYVTPSIDTLTEEGAKSSRMMKAGSVVMAVSGAPGLSAILNIDACIHDGFVGFRELSDEIDPIYFLGVLQTLRARNASQAVGATFLNLNTNQINNWSIPIPPRDLQLVYVTQAQRVREIELQHIEANKQLNDLLSSLLAQAFTGELTASWRDQHEAELIEAARERDALLSKSVIRGSARIMGTSTVTAEATVTRLAPPERAEMVAALSRKQQRVLNLANSIEGYFTLPQLFQSRHEASELSHADIHQGLYLLAALGLVRRVRVATEPIKNEIFFTEAYRCLLSMPDNSPSPEGIDHVQDDCRLRDLGRLLGADGG